MHFSSLYRIGGCNKLKYCSKCGNELLDEAVICPKCGCAVEAVPSMTSSANQLLKVSKQGKITTAMILIIIAFVLSLVSCLICWQGGYANPDFAANFLQACVTYHHSLERRD